jgi:superfamily II DNA/RNA helicase
VINFDPPSTPETYTHRIGRTGRSEESGKACTLVTREDSGWVRDTERVLGSPIPRRQFPGFEKEDLKAGSGGGRPGRSSSNRRRPSRDARDTGGTGPPNKRRRPSRKASGGSKRSGPSAHPLRNGN